MSDFVFYDKDEDVWGHVVYYCKCSRCGCDVEYRRKVNSKPLCVPCMNKKRNAHIQNKKRKQGIKELVKAVHGYYESFDKMPSIKAFDELVEYVSGLNYSPKNQGKTIEFGRFMLSKDDK